MNEQPTTRPVEDQPAPNPSGYQQPVQTLSGQLFGGTMKALWAAVAVFVLIFLKGILTGALFGHELSVTDSFGALGIGLVMAGVTVGVIIFSKDKIRARTPR